MVARFTLALVRCQQNDNRYSRVTSIWSSERLWRPVRGITGVPALPHQALRIDQDCWRRWKFQHYILCHLPHLLLISLLSMLGKAQIPRTRCTRGRYLLASDIRAQRSSTFPPPSEALGGSSCQGTLSTLSNRAEY